MDYNGLVAQLREHRDEQEVGYNKYMGNSDFYIKYTKLNMLIIVDTIEEYISFTVVKKGTYYMSKNMPKEIRDEIIKEINIGRDKLRKKKY